MDLVRKNKNYPSLPSGFLWDWASLTMALPYSSSISARFFRNTAPSYFPQSEFYGIFFSLKIELITFELEIFNFKRAKSKWNPSFCQWSICKKISFWGLIFDACPPSFAEVSLFQQKEKIPQIRKGLSRLHPWRLNSQFLAFERLVPTHFH